MNHFNLILDEFRAPKSSLGCPGGVWCGLDCAGLLSLRSCRQNSAIFVCTYGFCAQLQAFWLLNCVYTISGQFRGSISVLTCVGPLRWLLRPFEFEFFGSASCLFGSCRPFNAILRVKASGLAFQLCSCNIRSGQEVHFNSDLCGALQVASQASTDRIFRSCIVPARVLPPIPRHCTCQYEHFGFSKSSIRYLRASQ